MAVSCPRVPLASGRARSCPPSGGLPWHRHGPPRRCSISGHCRPEAPRARQRTCRTSTPASSSSDHARSAVSTGTASRCASARQQRSPRLSSRPWSIRRSSATCAASATVIGSTRTPAATRSSVSPETSAPRSVSLLRSSARFTALRTPSQHLHDNVRARLVQQQDQDRGRVEDDAHSDAAACRRSVSSSSTEPRVADDAYKPRRRLPASSRRSSTRRPSSVCRTSSSPAARPSSLRASAGTTRRPWTPRTTVARIRSAWQADANVARTHPRCSWRAPWPPIACHRRPQRPERLLPRGRCVDDGGDRTSGVTTSSSDSRAPGRHFLRLQQHPDIVPRDRRPRRRLGVSDRNASRSAVRRQRPATPRR